MKPDFMKSAAKIIAEIRTKTCIDDVDAEAIEELLKAGLKAYYAELEDYHIEEYHNAMNRARNVAYDDGFDDGYDVGYDNGYSDGHSAV